MRVLLTGGRGMLGRTICRVLGDAHEIVPTDLPEADIADEEAIDATVARVRPDAVVHCAAAVAVDALESDPGLAYRVNALGSANVASACNRRGARLLAVSTDYVFPGDAEGPHSEFDVATGGCTVYGKSKFAGEELARRLCPNHCICRVGWLYGFGGPSFVHTMHGLATGQKPFVSVVADQRGNPTSAVAVARQIGRLLERPKLCGTFHMTCEGDATWHDLAVEVFRFSGRAQDVRPCTTADFPRPAPRPADSRLDKAMFRLCGLPPMPHWKDALAEFMELEFGKRRRN